MVKAISSFSLSTEKTKKLEEMSKKLGHSKSSVIGDLIEEKYPEVCPSEMPLKKRYDVIMEMREFFIRMIEEDDDIERERKINHLKLDFKHYISEAFPEFINETDEDND